jgi:hypothetical protein
MKEFNSQVKKEMYDVLFIHPPNLFIFKDTFIPAGVISLMNSLSCSKKGIMYYELTDDLIKNTKIFVMDLHWYFTLFGVEKIAKRIKKINPGAKIIVGGYTASILANALIEKFDIDFVIRGDAEVPFTLLINKLLNNKDISDVPNITSKNFSTPLSYTLTQQDFDNSNYLDINWFPRFKKEMIEQQKSNFLPAIYPYIAVVKGCIHNCERCYGNPKLQKKICGRGIVIRTENIVKNDLLFWEKEKNINTVYIVMDFIDILDKTNNKKLEAYIDVIFSNKYNLNLSYSFFNLPPISILERMVKSFNRCYFSFPTLKNEYEKSGSQNFYKLKEILNFLKNKNCDIMLFISAEFTKYDIEYYKLTRNLWREFNYIKIQDVDYWGIPIPYPKDSKSELFLEFKRFHRKSKYDFYRELIKKWTIGFLPLIIRGTIKIKFDKIRFFIYNFVYNYFLK